MKLLTPEQRDAIMEARYETALHDKSFTAFQTWLNENTEEVSEYLPCGCSAETGCWSGGPACGDNPQHPCPEAPQEKTCAECKAVMLKVIATDCDYECPSCGRTE